MKHLITIIILCLIVGGCKKSAFLDSRPDQSLIVPTTLEDFQAILDDETNMNGFSQGIVPGLGEVAADNYYISNSNYNSTVPLYQRCYVWAQELYEGEQILEWNISYRTIYFCNIVLDGLPKLKISADQQQAYNIALGTALFYRAHCYYQLAQVFAPFYTQSNGNEWGIPLRSHSDVGEKISRATLKQTYDKIIEELTMARSLLPETTAYKTRASKVAVDALFSRLYLTMKDYDKALSYANSALSLQDALLDYNSSLVRPNNIFPFVSFKDNPEVIFQCTMHTFNSPLTMGFNIVDTTLYKLYDTNDLRKAVLFYNLGNYTFIGTYFGQSTDFFGGLATDEIYLNRAECNARKGNKDTALADVNKLLKARWKNNGTFVSITASTADEALQKILAERRKELCFRGLRWTDLRRLNSEGADISITRIVNGQSYTLPPNDNRWTYPIPDPVITSNPEMPQNPR